MFVIEVPFLDLNQIFHGPQPLRWIKLRDNMYVVQDGQSAIKVEQQKSRLILNCTEDEFYDRWFHYFDIETDYAEAYYSVARQDKFLKKCATRGGGIRIMKQDLFECIVASILNANSSSPDVCKFALRTIANKCGAVNKQSIRGVGKITWYEFPSPEVIIERANEVMLSSKMRDEVISVCKDIVDGWLSLDILKLLDKDEAREYLSEFIPDENALDYISLYGLHDLGCLPQCNFSSKVEQLKLKGNAEKNKGLIYAYVMNHKMNPPKNIVSEMKVGGHRWG